MSFSGRTPDSYPGDDGFDSLHRRQISEIAMTDTRTLIERLREGQRLCPLYKAAADEIERLQRDCAEAYQVLGVVSASAPGLNVDRALDNLSAAAQGDPRPHDDLLPFLTPE